MHRRLQFGMRENPASDRRHGSRRVVRSLSDAASIGEELGTSPPFAPCQNQSLADAHSKTDAVLTRTATADKRRDDNHLLTVQEVAALLRVPVSWVYGRMRKRSLERLPGYRLGKYWRFREDEIQAWVERRWEGGHSA